MLPNEQEIVVLERLHIAEELGWVAAGPRSTVSQSNAYFDMVFDLHNECAAIVNKEVQLALAHACIPHLEDSLRNITELDAYQTMHSWFIETLTQHALLVEFLTSSPHADVGACSLIMAAMHAEKNCKDAKRDLDLLMQQMPGFDKPTGRSINMEMVTDALFGTGTWLLYSNKEQDATLARVLLDAKLPFAVAITELSTPRVANDAVSVPIDLV